MSVARSSVGLPVESLGSTTLWSFITGKKRKSVRVKGSKIRGNPGYRVRTYMELVKKIAELEFRNREYVFLFRGQAKDYLTSRGNSCLHSNILRAGGGSLANAVMAKRYEQLARAEAALLCEFGGKDDLGRQRLKRHQVLRWSILQHYGVCDTPLLDVSQSLRIAASFASPQRTGDGYLFVLAVPNISGTVTTSMEHGLQVARLASACPPDALRPHVQEGFLMGEYPAIADVSQLRHYGVHELDFGRRVIAKFCFNTAKFWNSSMFPKVSPRALYPSVRQDKIAQRMEKIRSTSRH